MNYLHYEEAPTGAPLTGAGTISSHSSKSHRIDGKLTTMIVGICLGCIVTLATVAFTGHDNRIPRQTMVFQNHGEVEAGTLPVSPATGGTAALSSQTLTTVVEGTPVDWSTSTTRSGYPIYTSGAPRAIDWQGENPLPHDPDRTPGRNGLIGNPPVDPPSCHGRAYSSSYPVAPQ